MTVFLIQRVEDGKFVTYPGSAHTYTRNPTKARPFPSREAAETYGLCGNERIVDVASIVGESRWMSGLAAAEARLAALLPEYSTRELRDISGRPFTGIGITSDPASCRWFGGSTRAQRLTVGIAAIVEQKIADAAARACPYCRGTGRRPTRAGLVYCRH